MTRHVLVVEDDRAASQAICEHLAEHEYRCTHAGDLDEARLVLGRIAVDLVILDARLEGAGALAEEAGGKGVPALLLADDPSRVEPGRRVLAKPLRLAALLEAIDAILGERSVAGAPA
jgi:DNA-binding response OmpR family regulator